MKDIPVSVNDLLNHYKEILIRLERVVYIKRGASAPLNPFYNYLNLRSLLVPVGSLLVGVGDFQDFLFGKRFADNLQADR